MPSTRTSKLAVLGIVALTLVGTATSAFADRNRYTHRRFANPRQHMMMHHHMMHHRMMMHHHKMM